MITLDKLKSIILKKNRKPYKVCINCLHGAIGIAPSVGGVNDGVYCHSKKFAKHLDEMMGAIDRDDGYFDEYEANGFIHIFRLESIEEDSECACFEDRRSVDTRP